MDEIKDFIKKRLKQKAKPEVIKLELLEKGLLESDIDKLIKKQAGQSVKSYTTIKFSMREVFFKLTSGVGNDQFIYVFLFLLTGSYFLVGLTVGLSLVLSLLFSLFVYDYLKQTQISKSFVIVTGIVMFVLYLLIGVGIYFDLSFLIVIAFVLLGLGHVLQSEIFSESYEKHIEKKTESFLMAKMGSYTLFFAMFALIIIGFLLEKYNANDFYKNMVVLIVFGVAGLFAFLSSLMMKGLLIKKAQQDYSFGLFKYRIKTVWKRSKIVFENKVIRIILIASLLTSVVQAIGTAFYGVFVYEYFTNIAFKGFLNVAVIFTIPVITSLFAITMAKMLSKRYGNIPTLVFGSLLIAILPLVLWLKPNIINVSMGMVCSVIGGAMIGLGTGLLLSNYLTNKLRHYYFQSFTLIVSLVYLVFVPVGAFVADKLPVAQKILGLQILFLSLAVILVVIVVPLYFAIFFIEKRRVV